MTSPFNISGWDASSGTGIDPETPLCVQDLRIPTSKNAAGVDFPTAFRRTCRTAMNVSATSLQQIDSGESSDVLVPCHDIASGAVFVNVTANVSIIGCTVDSVDDAAVVFDGGLGTNVRVLIENCTIRVHTESWSATSAAGATNTFVALLFTGRELVGNGVHVSIVHTTLTVDLETASNTAALRWESSFLVGDEFAIHFQCVNATVVCASSCTSVDLAAGSAAGERSVLIFDESTVTATTTTGNKAAALSLDCVAGERSSLRLRHSHLNATSVGADARSKSPAVRSMPLRAPTHHRHRHQLLALR